MMFLLFVDEGILSQTTYQQVGLFSPFSWVETVLTEPLPIKIRPLELILIIIMLVAGAKGQRTKPMKSALFLAMGTTVAFLMFGIARGGDSRAAMWQVYLMLATPMGAFAISSVYRTAAHFRELAKWVVAAGIYRAIMCIICYFTLRGRPDFPQWMTTHADTVLWVVSISVLTVNFLEDSRTRSAKLGAYLGIPVLLAAVQFNNRRLAYVSLLGAMVALYFLLPPTKAKQRLKKIVMILVPVLGLYVAVGWGRQEKIFKPLQSLSSVSSKPDASTLARNVENLSLIATAGYSSWITGTGWGHKYVELSNKYSIAAAMELWPYIPHNSVLGLFGYTGCLGVLGFWMMFPTAVFFHARTARLARDSLHRASGLVGVMTVVTCTNQMFGDMGIFSWVNMYMMSMCWAAALRVPIEADVWPGNGAPAAPVAVGGAAPASVVAAARSVSSS
jgi:hypothetical protein